MVVGLPRVNARSAAVGFIEYWERNVNKPATICEKCKKPMPIVLHSCRMVKPNVQPEAGSRSREKKEDVGEVALLREQNRQLKNMMKRLKEEK